MTEFTHRIALRDGAADPTGDAASMLSEGYVYPPDRPSRVLVEAPAPQFFHLDGAALWRVLMAEGAHPDSTLHVRESPRFPKEVLSPCPSQHPT